MEIRRTLDLLAKLNFPMKASVSSGHPYYTFYLILRVLILLIEVTASSGGP